MFEVADNDFERLSQGNTTVYAGNRPLQAVRRVIIVLLLVAVTLKTSVLVTEPTPDGNRFATRPFQIALFVMLSLWLKITRREMNAWRLCVLLFGVLASVASRSHRR